MSKIGKIILSADVFHNETKPWETFHCALLALGMRYLMFVSSLLATVVRDFKWAHNFLATCPFKHFT